MSASAAGVDYYRCGGNGFNQQFAPAGCMVNVAVSSTLQVVPNTCSAALCASFQ